MSETIEAEVKLKLLRQPETKLSFNDPIRFKMAPHLPPVTCTEIKILSDLDVIMAKVDDTWRVLDPATKEHEALINTIYQRISILNNGK